MTAPALDVEHLTTEVFAHGRILPLIERVSFRVARGEVLALVGESGSGKSVAGLSVMGLMERPARVSEGRIRLGGREVRHDDAEAMRALRGRDIAMVFQDPMTTLNPVMRIGEQMAEAIRVHDRGVDRREARSRAREALGAVGVPAPDERLDAYPHQLSGGMRQRVVIATALLNRPSVVIADEPTTALDVTTQGQILHETKRLTAEFGMALVWITHDLAVVASLADRIAVMYAGRIVEEGPAEDVLAAPLHPYTRGLIDSVPPLDARQARLRSIRGMPPAVGSITAGCRFAPRCDRAVPACGEEPPLAAAGPDRAARCIRPLGRGPA